MNSVTDSSLDTCSTTPAHSLQNKDNILYEGALGSIPWKLFNADSRTLLHQLPAKSVDSVITSPPYYWQRDYQVEGQIGLEPTIEAYVDNIINTFRGVKHVLKDSGTVFLNIGDTYYSAKGLPHGSDSKHKGRDFSRKTLRAVDGPGLGLPRKSLIGIPWRVALALGQDGWTLRSSIVWVRRTAMPEPTARDRPWRNYEFIFVFSKGPKYFFNREGLEKEEDVWHIEPDRASLSRGKHYAPYPRELVARCIRCGCPEDGLVLDPFVGGGTTMSVALEMGRSTIGIELNPSFCESIASALQFQNGTQLILPSA